MSEHAKELRPIRAHVEGCRYALATPVDLCACGGRGFYTDAQNEQLQALVKAQGEILPLVVETGQERADGVTLIAAERLRQIEREGWSPEHDDLHDHGQMAVSAVRYAIEDLPISVMSLEVQKHLREVWPWESCWWKPKDAISNLVRAGALIAAEIDRRIRKGDGR